VCTQLRSLEISLHDAFQLSLQRYTKRDGSLYCFCLTESYETTNQSRTQETGLHAVLLFANKVHQAFHNK